MYHSKLKNAQKKLFMDEKSFQGLPLVFDRHCIPFQAPAVSNEKVYFPVTLIVFFHNANILLKALTLFFTQIYTVLWKIVKVCPQKMQFDWHSCPEFAETSEILQFLSCIPHSSVFTESLYLLTSLTAWRTVQLRSVLRQTLGASWVLLVEGFQIYQPWVSPCLSVGTSVGKQSHCFTCPLPSQSSSALLRTWYVRLEVEFFSVQRKGETERYARLVLTFVLTATLIGNNVGRQLGCIRDTENKDALYTNLGVLGIVQTPYDLHRSTISAPGS